MGLRYSFQLVYPAIRISGVLVDIGRMRPNCDRGRPLAPAWNDPQTAMDATDLTHDRPLFCEVSLLFPAVDEVRAYYPLGDVTTEWTEGRVECLPVGFIDLEVRIGVKYALVGFRARTSRMSDLFRGTPAVWDRFSALLASSGGLIGLFDGVDRCGIARYPLLPEGHEAVEFDFFDFVLEERDNYWHIDTDRYAEAVLQAPRVAGRIVG